MHRQWGQVMLVAVLIAVCCLGALSTAAAFTQAAPWPGTVSGTITNGETGDPVSGASVELFDAGGKRAAGPVASDAKGAFGLDAPQPGSYTLVAKHESYETLATTIVVGLDPLPPVKLKLNEYHMIEIPPDEPGAGEDHADTALGALLSTLLPGLAIGLLLLIGAAKSREVRHHN